MQCQAFNKKDKRRCRLKSEPHSKTCQIHRNYFSNWPMKHSPTKCWFDLSIREKREFRFQISNKNVEIPEWFIRRLNASQLYYFFYLMIYTDHSPLLNKLCFDLEIEKVARCILYKSYKNDLLSLFDYYLKSTDCSFYSLEKFISYFYSIHGTTLFEFLQPILLRDSWRPLLYSSKFGTGMLKLATRYPYITIDRFIRLFNIYHANRVKSKCENYKEELIQKVWNPSRLEKFLNMGYSLEAVFDS